MIFESLINIEFCGKARLDPDPWNCDCARMGHPSLFMFIFCLFIAVVCFGGVIFSLLTCDVSMKMF